MVEVNSETDFVARNEQFQGLVKMIAQVALKAGADVEKINAAPVGSLTVERAIQDAIATIGENMSLRPIRRRSIRQASILQSSSAKRMCLPTNTVSRAKPRT